MKNPSPLFPSFLISTLLLFSCSGNEENKTTTQTDTIANDTTFIPKEHPDSVRAAILKTVPKNVKPIFGYRFIIEGDFNGDEKKETLTEHYINTVTNKESAKFYDSTVTHEQLVALNYEKYPKSVLVCSDKKIDTSQVEWLDQLFGLAFLRNEGDLDGDGGDEISFVVFEGTFSIARTFCLWTYKKGEWKEYISFGIHEGELPVLPDENPEYTNKVSETDTTYINFKKELKAFPGFITKLGNGKIKIKTSSDESGNYIFREIDLSKLER